MTYSIHDHAHRFAAWAACRAASTSPVYRFEVKLGVKALEACGFAGSFTVENLPNPSQFDTQHKKWREIVLKTLRNGEKKATHGIAAKLINTYLKSRFVCGGYNEHDAVKAIHPPIDSVLLKALRRKNVGGYESEWIEFENIRWSKFSCEEYTRSIDLIKKAVKKEPLWTIEKYWQGYR